ncbi:MAG: exosortase/archaeosortase family protein [Phycisphaerales bacterium]|nr:exosortase/archaeosortase family protein [Phycisphaerales bacterium]
MMRLSGWKRTDALALAGLVVLAIIATGRTWAEIFEQALRSEEDSHILMAIPIACWLLWLRRGRLRMCRPTWSFLGPAMIVLGVAMDRIGILQALEIFRHTGALLVVIGAAVSVLGPRFVVQFLPVFAALFFLMPVPGRIRQQIAIPLQNVSAQASQFLLDLFGVPSTRSGNVLVINNNEVAIAEACNGMRMVAALALISFAFIFSVPMRNGVRLAILAVSPAIAVVVNIARLVPTVLLYGYANPGAADLFHDLSGWAVLLLALALLWGFLSILRWIEVRIDPYPVTRR